MTGPIVAALQQAFPDWFVGICGGAKVAAHATDADPLAPRVVVDLSGPSRIARVEVWPRGQTQPRWFARPETEVQPLVEDVRRCLEGAA
jgi:anaerobic glycerol-3-phosphate dehydrogenase